jgi:hypothetical protein
MNLVTIGRYAVTTLNVKTFQRCKLRLRVFGDQLGFRVFFNAIVRELKHMRIALRFPDEGKRMMCKSATLSGASATSLYWRSKARV